MGLATFSAASSFEVSHMFLFHTKLMLFRLYMYVFVLLVLTSFCPAMPALMVTG